MLWCRHPVVSDSLLCCSKGGGCNTYRASFPLTISEVCQVHVTTGILSSCHALTHSLPPTFSTLSRSFQMIKLFTSLTEILELRFRHQSSREYSVLISFGVTGLVSLLPRLSKSSPLHRLKVTILQVLCLLSSQTLRSSHDTGKTRTLDTMDICQQCLCFSIPTVQFCNMAFHIKKGVIWFHRCSHLSRSFCRAKKRKCVTSSPFSSIAHSMGNGVRCIILDYLKLNSYLSLQAVRKPVIFVQPHPLWGRDQAAKELQSIVLENQKHRK